MTKEELIKENEKLKTVIREGKEIVSFLNDTLGLESAAKSNFFMAKIAGIITKVQRNPEIFNRLSEYLNKLKNIDV